MSMILVAVLSSGVALWLAKRLLEEFRTGRMSVISKVEIAPPINGPTAVAKSEEAVKMPI